MSTCCFSNKKYAKILLLGTEEKINFQRADMTFYTFINYFRKLILYFSFTIPHKVVSKDFVYFLGTANLRNNSSLVRTISIACMILCQRLIVPNVILIDSVVLGRSLGKNSCSEYFYKTREVIDEGSTY